MVEVLPINFPVPGERATASYDFIDIAEGTGIVNFQAFRAQVSGALTSHLSTEAILSSRIEQSMNTGEGLNFDLPPFNLPKILKGSGYMNFSAAVNNAGTGSNMYLDIYVYKVSGVDVTQIAKVTTALLSHTGAGTTIMNFTVPMTLTQTHFKIGDILRVFVNPFPIEVGTTAVIAHDPGNRNGTIITPASTYPTAFNIYIPFLIDL